MGRHASRGPVETVVLRSLRQRQGRWRSNLRAVLTGQPGRKPAECAFWASAD